MGCIWSWMASRSTTISRSSARNDSVFLHAFGEPARSPTISEAHLWLACKASTLEGPVLTPFGRVEAGNNPQKAGDFSFSYVDILESNVFGLIFEPKYTPQI